MAKNIAASRQKKPGGLSDKVSDIVLVVICAAVMLIVAYPLYYVLVASFSDPYDVYAGKTFLLPSQFTPAHGPVGSVKTRRRSFYDADLASCCTSAGRYPGPPQKPQPTAAGKLAALCDAADPGGADHRL